MEKKRVYDHNGDRPQLPSHASARHSQQGKVSTAPVGCAGLCGAVERILSLVHHSSFSRLQLHAMWLAFPPCQLHLFISFFAERHGSPPAWRRPGGSHSRLPQRQVLLLAAGSRPAHLRPEARGSVVGARCHGTFFPTITERLLGACAHPLQRFSVPYVSRASLALSLTLPVIPTGHAGGVAPHF